MLLWDENVLVLIILKLWVAELFIVGLELADETAIRFNLYECMDKPSG